MRKLFCILLLSLATQHSWAGKEFLNDLGSVVYEITTKKYKKMDCEECKAKDEAEVDYQLKKLAQDVEIVELLSRSLPYRRDNIFCNHLSYTYLYQLHNLHNYTLLRVDNPTPLTQEVDYQNQFANDFFEIANILNNGFSADYISQLDDNLKYKGKIRIGNVIKQAKYHASKNTTKDTQNILSELPWMVIALKNISNKTYKNEEAFAKAYEERAKYIINTENCTRYDIDLYPETKNVLPIEAINYVQADFVHINFLAYAALKRKAYITGKELTQEMIDLTLEQIANENPLVPNTRELFNLGLAMSYSVHKDDAAYKQSTVYKLAKIQYQKFSKIK